ncbi:hypothetical protein cyc_06669 [Cyclospora cayetanensis]|uniref:Uncharacterized protein n=1 Tax=Cyclospora cayetanensis TaxID=88456 RepID=A0A1D3D3K7_9EIME|nr:hypothetical protein cyc_06669 [Cyclospora cayetanensis]
MAEDPPGENTRARAPHALPCGGPCRRKISSTPSRKKLPIQTDSCAVNRRTRAEECSSISRDRYGGGPPMQQPRSGGGPGGGAGGPLVGGSLR